MTLKGKQKKLDKNKNGKIDAQDFKMMKKKPVKKSSGGPLRGTARGGGKATQGLGYNIN